MDTFLRTKSTVYYDNFTTLLRDGEDGGGVDVIEHDYYFDGSGAGLACMFDDLHNILGIDATSFDGEVTLTTTLDGVLNRIDLKCSTGIKENVIGVTAPWALRKVLNALKKHGLNVDTTLPVVPSTTLPEEDRA